LDELSTLGPTRISELQNGQVKTWNLDPQELGVAPANLTDLQVANAAESAEKIRGILNGETSPARDIAMLNAAAALVIAGRAAALSDGLKLAAESIDSSAAKRSLELLTRYSRAD
jgi:anthranilate phosphoribosyltransferase